MLRLINANLNRLFRHKGLWISLVAAFALSATNILTSVKHIDYYAKEYDQTLTLEMVHFETFLLVILICAIFCGMFFGTEYSNKIIRNKLICGLSRSDIYFANFITACVGNLLILSAFLSSAVVGIKDFGYWSFGIKDSISYILIQILIIISFTALITTVFMLIDSKAISIVTLIIGTVLLLYLGEMIYQMLAEPAVLPPTQYYDTATGGMTFVDGGPNPEYVSGNERIIYETILNFIPLGQSAKVSNVDVEKPFFMEISSVVSAVVFNIIGFTAFRKKDIK